MQQPEDLELARLEVVRGVRGAQPAHRLLADQRQQQAGPGAVLVEHARRRSGGGLRGGRRHHRVLASCAVENLAGTIIEIALLFAEPRYRDPQAQEIDMQAITLDEPDAQPALREDLPAPAPAGNEVLVRVHASSVNPVDGSIASGMLAQMGIEYVYPVILGRDYAGVVERVGADVSQY